MSATRADEDLKWDGFNGKTGLTAFVVSSPAGERRSPGWTSGAAGEIDAAMTELLMAAHLLVQPLFASQSLASEAAEELLGTIAAITRPSMGGQFACTAGAPPPLRANVFVFLPTQALLSTHSSEIAAVRFLAQSVLAYTEIVSFIAEPHIKTDGKHCVIWQQSGVC